MSKLVYISIPVTGSDNKIIAVSPLVTCIRQSSTSTVLVVEGGVGGSSSADQVEITHSADTAINSVSKSVMSAVVLASSGNDGKVEIVVPAQAISAIEFSGTADPVNIYNADGTVAAGRVATIADDLTWTGGRIKRIANGVNIVEVTQASDLPATLVANTTYIIRGTISTNTPISVTNQGCSIIGLDRNKDKLVWTGLTGTTMLTITDVDFDLEGIWLSSTITGSVLMAADNYDGAAYNSGRLKVLTITNCQFRNCFDIASIEGFDLVDISNTLFFYVEAPNFGLKFLNTSKIEITSCELIRWFDETSIPTPSGYSTASMIEISPNGGGPGIGAVNINGCIIHPQQTQNGINIDASSTTGFGTISSNAFINVGLTTGEVFLPIASGLPDYSQTATYNYDIFANQGVLNSTSGIMMTVSDNTNDTDLTDGVPAKIETDGLALTQAAVRFSLNIDGRCTYVGTKQIYVSIHATVGFDKQGGGTDNYVFYIYKNGAQLPGSQTKIRTGGNEGTLGMTYGTLMETNDYIEIWIEVVGSNDDMLIQDLQFLIRE